MSSKKKRSIFAAFESLEAEDRATAKLRKKQTSKTAERAKAARSQTKIYSHLMETRILLQRSFQQATTYLEEEEKKTTNNNDDDNTSNSDSHPTSQQQHQPRIIKECNHLLDQLLEARRKLTGMEENISSLAEADHNDQAMKEEEEMLDSEYKTCQEHWKEVLNRRHQDLKLHSGLAASAKTQFRVMDSSFWDQVEATVHHEEIRLQQHQRAAAANNDSTVTALTADFDDSKVYQHMLKDFLVLASTTSAANAATDGSAASYKRVKSQQHLQKKVDRKASKGRRIRYVEIPKLANFTFPLSKKGTKNNLAEDEWFQSLFGGTHLRKTNTSDD